MMNHSELNLSMAHFNVNNMKIIPILIFLSLIIISLNLSAQQNVNRELDDSFQTDRLRKNILIPDLPDYLTLKGDFHTHTIFSDGSVTPDFRVVEAWTEGLDIIAITDHIEHRPNKNILPNNLNLGYELASSKAKELDILLIPGAEISKKMPNPGHFNLLFVKDVNKLINEDPMVQIEEAIKQDAFIIWNHPGSSWVKPIVETTQYWDIHKDLLMKGWLHGIEVFNTDEWFPIALEWCNKDSLTIFSNTDIHTPINYWYDLSESTNHRAMTLVFASSRNVESVKDALFEKRTVGFFGNTLVGSEQLLTELFHASVKLVNNYKLSDKNGRTVFFSELQNPTDIPFILKKTGDNKNNDRSDLIKLMPRSNHLISYSSEIEYLEFELINFYVTKRKHPIIKLNTVK